MAEERIDERMCCIAILFAGLAPKALDAVLMFPRLPCSRACVFPDYFGADWSAFPCRILICLDYIAFQARRSLESEDKVGKFVIECFGLSFNASRHAYSMAISGKSRQSQVHLSRLS